MHAVLTLISVNPARTNLSFTGLTAWNGVGDALTKFRKSLAADLIFLVVIVEALALKYLIGERLNMQGIGEEVQLWGLCMLNGGSS